VTFFDDEQPDRPGTEVLLKRVHEVISNARPMPLSASVMINKDELLELLDEAIARLPEEIRQARWLLKEREEFLAKVQREGDDILDASRARAERMVQRAEVVRAAQHTARRLVEEAEAESRRLRHEAEDYCDHKLAQFEIVLDRTIRTVQAGRARLHQAPLDQEPQAEPSGRSPEPRYDDGSSDLYDEER
jgi:cell division septum initiation protein DivIVA